MEFSYDKYWLLPYEYIIIAIINTTELRRRELHENEIPIAMLAVQQAEMNRDRKARKKPFMIDEFYCYPSDEEKDKIDSVYGVAALELIKQRKFPLWGLFIYKELAQACTDSKGMKAPEILCYQSEDAILLAPKIDNCVCKCMLIALESASNRVMHMESPCGRAIKARIPEVNNKVIAIENCYLDIY